MADRFSPRRALGVSEKPYESYFEKDVGPDPFTFTADRGYSASPMMVTKTDAYSDQFNELATRDALERLAGQKDIITGKTDWVSPEGQKKRMDYLMKGVTTPQQEYAMERMARPQGGRYSQVPSEVLRATAPLEHIDPTDPDAWNKMTSVLGQMDADDQLAEVRGHPHFRETLNDLKRSIIQLRPNRPEETDDRLWYAMKGGNPDDFDSGMFLTPEGKVDRAKMAYHIAQQKNAPKSVLSTTEMRQLEKAAEEIAPISDPAKAQAFKVQFGRDPVTPEDWRIAWNLAAQAVAPKTQALADVVADLEARGAQVPERYRKMVQSMTPAEVQQAPQSPQEDRVVVRTMEEWQALPPGTKYIDGKGRQGTKK